MLLESKIKSEITSALREKHEIKKNVLRLVVGEAQTLEARTGPPKDSSDSDNRYIKIIKKMVDSNSESLKALKEGDLRVAILGTENYILTQLLPAEQSPEDLAAFLSQPGYLEQIKGTKSDGQATGIGMKILKAAGQIVSGEVVSKAVKTLRQ